MRKYFRDNFDELNSNVMSLIGKGRLMKTSEARKKITSTYRLIENYNERDSDNRIKGVLKHINSFEKELNLPETIVN